jgi:hypothetical protein
MMECKLCYLQVVSIWCDFFKIVQSHIHQHKKIDTVILNTLAVLTEMLSDETDYC